MSFASLELDDREDRTRVVAETVSPVDTATSSA